MDEMNILLEPNQKTVLSLQKAAVIGSFIVIAIGILCLLGWQFHIVFLTSFFPGIIGMYPLSAIGFICSGSALLLQLKNQKESIKSWGSLGSLILSIIVILIGVFTSITFVSGNSFGTDALFFANKFIGNRISPNTGISFLCIGIALVFLQFHYKKYFTRTAQIFILTAAIISMLAVVGYAYQEFFFYQFISFSPMPLSSALTFAIFCLALLATRSNGGFTQILTRNTPSSVLALRLIMISLILPAILGCIGLLIEQLHYINTQTVNALLVIANSVVFSIIVWINTRSLQKLELENLIIKNQLEQKNIKLEGDAKALAAKVISMEEDNEKREQYESLILKTTPLQPLK